MGVGNRGHEWFEDTDIIRLSRKTLDVWRVTGMHITYTNSPYTELYVQYTRSCKRSSQETSLHSVHVVDVQRHNVSSWDDRRSGAVGLFQGCGVRLVRAFMGLRALYSIWICVILCGYTVDSARLMEWTSLWVHNAVSIIIFLQSIHSICSSLRFQQWVQEVQYA